MSFGFGFGFNRQYRHPSRNLLNPSVGTLGLIRFIRNYSNGNTTNSANNWVEIQTYCNGTNVALNKSVTGDFTPSSGFFGQAVNDDTVTSGVVSTDASLHYVQVDLGQLYNVDYINVFHYGVGRTYHSTKTQVSANGQNWTTIFDSSVSGEYTETSSGHYESCAGIKAGYASANQVVVGGDFSKDTNSDGLADGFTSSNVAGLSCSGGTQKFTATAQNGYVAYGLPLTAGHRYFVTAYVKASSNKVCIEARTNATTYPQTFHTGNGQYQWLGQIINIDSGFASGTFYAAVDNNTSGFAEIDVQFAKAYDMGVDTSNPLFNLSASAMAAIAARSGYFEGSQNVGGVSVQVENDGSITKDGIAVKDTWIEFMPTLTTSLANVYSYAITFMAVPYTLSKQAVSGSITGTPYYYFKDDITSSQPVNGVTLQSAYSFTPSANSGVTRAWVYIPAGTIFALYKPPPLSYIKDSQPELPQ